MGPYLYTPGRGPLCGILDSFPTQMFCGASTSVFFGVNRTKMLIFLEGWWFDAYMMQPLVFSTPTNQKHPFIEWSDLTWHVLIFIPISYRTPRPLAERSCLSLWDILGQKKWKYQGVQMIHGSLGSVSIIRKEDGATPFGESWIPKAPKIGIQRIDFHLGVVAKLRAKNGARLHCLILAKGINFQ